MIGLDTRNLLRLLLKYDEEQSEGVVALLGQLPEIGSGHVDRVTLLTTGQVKIGVSDLPDSLNIRFENGHLVLQMLAETERSDAEFAKLYMTLQSHDTSCTNIRIYDAKAAGRIPGMELLT